MKPSGHWVKIWTSVLQSVKHQSLDPKLFKAWVNFSLIAKVHDDFIPSDAQIAWDLRITEKEAKRQREALMAEGLIDETSQGLMMHDWDEWQATSTKRVLKHRMKQKRNADETPDETQMKRVVKQAEKEKEVEEEKEPPIVPQPFESDSAFQAVWETYPKQGRTRRPLCEQIFCELIKVANGNAAHLARRILEPLLPGGKWAESKLWRDGYVSALADYLKQRRWDEDPEPAEKQEDWTNGL